MRPTLYNSRYECPKRSTERDNSRENQARMFHSRTPSKRSFQRNFPLSKMPKQRLHTEHSYGTHELKPTDIKNTKKLKKYFRKLATKLMVDTKQVCCGDTTANSRIPVLRRTASCILNATL